MTNSLTYTDPATGAFILLAIFLVTGPYILHTLVIQWLPRRSKTVGKPRHAKGAPDLYRRHGTRSVPAHIALADAAPTRFVKLWDTAELKVMPLPTPPTAEIPAIVEQMMGRKLRRPLSDNARFVQRVSRSAR